MLCCDVRLPISSMNVWLIWKTAMPNVKLMLIFWFRSKSCLETPVTTCFPRQLHAFQGSTQMQTLFGGTRLASALTHKAAQSVADSALPLWCRQSSQLTSAFRAAGSSASAACLHAQRCLQCSTTHSALHAQHGRSLAHAVLNSSKGGQGRGFAAQAVAKSGSQRFMISLFNGSRCLRANQRLLRACSTTPSTCHQKEAVNPGSKLARGHQLTCSGKF